MKNTVPITAAKKTVRLSAVLLTSLLLLTSCSAAPKTDAKAVYSPTLVITGDVVKELSIKELAPYPVHTVKDDGTDVSCILLKDALNAAQVQGEELLVYFSSPDGIMASMPYEQAINCYITLCETGWTLIAPNHPPQANVKEMTNIVVCAQGFSQTERCFRVNDGDIGKTYSYGQLFLMDTVSSVVLEGEPKKQANGVTYNVNAYTRRNLIALSQVTGKSEGTAICYVQDGSQIKIELNGYLHWQGNSVDYVAANRRNRIADVTGIWLNAPQASVTDVAPIAIGNLTKGKVLVIEIDGLGYGAYRQFTQNGCDTLKRFSVQQARAVMPSISNVSLAAIVSGQTPDKTTVKERKDRTVAVDDMFKTAAGMGKTCAVIEGDTLLVTMSLDQTLNADTNGNGHTDDEVQKSALLAVASGIDLVYVHYHGLDDVGHTTGPFSDEALLKAREIDQYIKALTSGFSGTVLLIADHGMHRVDNADKLGVHGTFMPADMIVPLGIWRKK